MGLFVCVALSSSAPCRHPTASTRAEHGGAQQAYTIRGGRGYPGALWLRDRKAAKALYLPQYRFCRNVFSANQRTINLLGEDAKLPTMSFDPSTQSFKYNILDNPGRNAQKDPSTGGYIPTEVRR